jgi:hypothetical protein
MKINKLILAAAISLGLASYSYADDIYLTGSTAMRGNVYNVLTAAGAANSVFSGGPTKVTTWGNATASKATYMDITGTIIGGHGGLTTLHCDWTGSEAGILNVASNTTALFSGDPDNGLVNSTNPGTTFLHNVDMCMADNAQAYSRTPKPTVSGSQVAVISFEWVRNNGIWTGSNITDDEIQQALSGYCPIGVVTGNTNGDTSSYVYVSGRDNSSGTRVNAFGDSGFGIFTSPEQVELNGAGVMLQDPVTLLYAEDWGFSSGGSLAASLAGNTLVSPDEVAATQLFPPQIINGFSVIAYLGYSDATTAVGNGCTVLTYDGVPFSVNAIQEGEYTFWGNEYIFENAPANQNSVNDAAFFTDMVNDIPEQCWPNVTSPAAIALSAMNCSRSGPLSAPGHN